MDNTPSIRVAMANSRELILAPEPGRPDRWLLAFVAHDNGHHRCAGSFSNLTRRETYELLMGLQAIAQQVDRGGLPNE